jgi:hypothetical protein
MFSIMTRFAKQPAGRLSLALVLLPLASGCDTVLDRAVIRSDSAGVAIVESRRPAWPEGAGWTVVPAPSYTLDGPRPDAAFIRIEGVVLLDGGGVAVADGGDMTVHFFDGTGTLIRSVRPGDAPVMPRSISRLYRSGDEVHVAQRGLQPTLVFDRTGAFVREIAPPAVDGFPFLALYRQMQDGSLLAIQPPTGLIPRGEEWTESAAFVRITADGGAERVLSLPAVRFKRLPSAVEAEVYGPVLQFAFADDGVWAGYPERYDIGFWGPDGEMERRIRRAWEPVAVSPDEAAAVRERLSALLDEAGIPEEPELREQPEQQIRELAIADSLPAFGRLVLDHEGHLWVERVPPLPIVIAGPNPVRPEPTPWDVFDTDGAWLGTTATPADTHVMDIGADAVAGVLRSGGTARVVVHRIERDPGQD